MRRNRRVIAAALASAGVGVAACAAVTGTGPAAYAAAATHGAAEHSATKHGATEHGATEHGATKHGAAGTSGAAAVIIFFKSEFAGTASRDRSAERLAQIQAAQVPYLGQLRSLGATDVHRYRLVNAIAARVPSAALDAVAASAGVAAVIPDSAITGPTPSPAPTVPPSTAYSGVAATTSMRTPDG